ncbi:MAG: M15 family metallopeptidase [Bernardetiaceae bacterium]
MRRWQTLWGIFLFLTTNIHGQLSETDWVDILQLDSTFVLDVRYATPNNFMGKVIYPCPKVLLRHAVAKDLVRAHLAFKEMGYRIKIFDGYRPHSLQWELWNNTPNKAYVADPSKYGSRHSRGAAVDLTLVDSAGEELDMGTDYDFFGAKAHHTYMGVSAQVRQNRQLLKETLAKYGFSSIRSEWWHYNHQKKFPLADIPLPCP